MRTSVMRSTGSLLRLAVRRIASVTARRTRKMSSLVRAHIRDDHVTRPQRCSRLCRASPWHRCRQRYLESVGKFSFDYVRGISTSVGLTALLLAR